MFQLLSGVVYKININVKFFYLLKKTKQVYPYLVVNDGILTESCREERVLQLLRMLNLFLTKQKVRYTKVK